MTTTGQNGGAVQCPPSQSHTATTVLLKPLTASGLTASSWHDCTSRRHRLHCRSRLQHHHEVRLLCRQGAQQHLIKVLVDADVVAHALAPPCLDHELTGQGLHRGGLQRPQHHALVQGVTGHNLPVVKHTHAERLTLCVVAQVCLKAEALHHGQEGLDDEDGRAGLGHVGCHVAAPLGQHVVDGRQAVRRCLDLHVVHRLHESGCCHEEGGVADTACCGDDLAASPVDGLWGDLCIQDLELDVPDGLVTQWPLASAPLEALHDGVPDCIEQVLIHLPGQGVVHQHVGSLPVRSECP
mmetsp:Transcript_18570/g.39864  ORF Transcript_18570/g.39864 Transcript_18570/m.39864 type:complete len:296 (+) Transcript_18570:357-1244(+)